MGGAAPPIPAQVKVARFGTRPRRPIYAVSSASRNRRVATGIGRAVRHMLKSACVDPARCALAPTKAVESEAVAPQRMTTVSLPS